MEKILFDYLANYIELNPDEKQAIIDLDIFKQFKKGTILLKEGQYSEYGYFVVKGCIRTYFVIDGEEKTTNFYTEADSLEPLCKIDKSKSTYFVSCAEDCILIVANSDMEQTIFDKFPKFQTLCRILSENRLAAHSIEFDNFKTSSPEKRYLTLLDSRPDLFQRVPQHQIASYLGITAQSLSRLRNRLSSK